MAKGNTKKINWANISYKVIYKTKTGRQTTVAKGNYKFVRKQAEKFLRLPGTVFIKSQSPNSTHLYSVRYKHHSQKNYNDDLIATTQIY